ncbi:hypothetical protein MGYG_08949 [Nannizzia gypsea CBS 118893]|uniref:Uncharacterized protein n=1 Tax=Arthroderma gypseum (strain ATCC MYA-4604 / CBS 118893) TaxID=535722 RepID=E5R3G7_ARTGP|nr:hypothetical protein MGYG_08949 [Nannizzia gypsea CBS 118893]EFQ98766.1 hypothetical protein MGYG_08949 [Nannizzia gypsea CBS 118893]
MTFSISSLAFIEAPVPYTKQMPLNLSFTYEFWVSILLARVRSDTGMGGTTGKLTLLRRHATLLVDPSKGPYAEHLATRNALYAQHFGNFGTVICQVNAAQPPGYLGSSGARDIADTQEGERRWP